MSPLQPLREFIRQRLTAAAEEIFSEVEKSIVLLEEELRLQDGCWKPRIETSRTERPTHRLHGDDSEVVLTERQSGFHQVQRRLSHKEDLENPECSWLDGDQLEAGPPQQEAGLPTLPTGHQEDLGHSEVKDELEDSGAPPRSEDQEEQDGAEVLQIKEEEVEQFVLKQEHFDLTEPLPQNAADLAEGEPNAERLSAETRSGEGGGLPPSDPTSASTSDKSVTCDICGKVFKKKHHFNRHQRIHSGVRPYSCTICGKGFTQSGHLKNHIRTHTGERPFACHTCGKSFSQVVSLNVHMRIHTGERPYSCEICGKSFTVVTNLNFHRGTHADERPFPCETCGKGFGNYTALKAHRRIHTQGRLHFCQTCGKSFAKNAVLNVHMRTHTGERPYLCERCGKRFISKGDLKAHVRTHTGERPFSCATCGKSFIQRGTLNVHMRSHATGGASAD